MTPAVGTKPPGFRSVLRGEHGTAIGGLALGAALWRHAAAPSGSSDSGPPPPPPTAVVLGAGGCALPAVLAAALGAPVVAVEPCPEVGGDDDARRTMEGSPWPSRVEVESIGP